MLKKSVWLVLILTIILPIVSGCGGAIIEVGVEPPLEQAAEAEILSGEAADETRDAKAVPPIESAADDSSMEDTNVDAPVSHIGNNPDGSTTYTNAEYGFRFSYPADWSLTETPAQEMPDESGFDQGPSIQLTKTDILLFIGYRHGGEQAIWWTGVGAFGDEMPLDTITFLGQEVKQVALGFDGDVKFISYDAVAGGPLSAGGLEFGIRLDDMSGRFVEEMEIPPEIIEEAAAILTSFELLP